MSTGTDALGAVSIFGGLSDAGLAFLDERLESVAVEAGGTFFREGDLGDSVFVLQSGRAEVRKSRGGVSLVLAILGPGACFGEIALIGICPRTATVCAVDHCRALRLSNRVLLELYRHHPEQFTLVQMNLGREVARRLVEMHELVLDLTATDADRAAGSPLVARLANDLK